MLLLKKFTVPKEFDQKRFDLVCVSLSGLSRKKIRGLIDTGQAFLNGKGVWLAKFAVSSGDVIELRLQEQSEVVDKRFFGLDSSSILLENKDFLAINKPPGLAVDSEKENVLTVLCKMQTRFNSIDLRLAHRLDKDTSGTLIISKNESTRSQLGKLFADRQIQKTYRALCFDTPPDIEGSIELAIGQDLKGKNLYHAVPDLEGKNSLNIEQKIDLAGIAKKQNMRNSKKSDFGNYIDDNFENFDENEELNSKNARQARTDYLVIQTFVGKRISYLECYPKTGRPHQIRVHLRAIGNPILGDKLYSRHLAGRHPNYQLAPRQMLHAYKLEFELNSQHFNINAPIPNDMQKLINLLDNL